MLTPPGPPLDVAELTRVAGEAEVLPAFLDYQRMALRHKVAGVSEADARRRLVPSQTTLGGLLRHMAAVERNWFQRVLARRSPEEIDGEATGGTESWHVPDDLTVADLLAEYDRACEESRRIAAAHRLDDTAPHRRLGEVSLRWIYVHMIEETARHAGHADILREQIDGATGDNF
ncbi:MAG TPA: DinB family protein [Natronosporangium sp.]